MEKARGRIGRPYLRWHDLRHTFVALRVAAGAHPTQIHEEAGHSSFKTTMDGYRRMSGSLGEKVADRMEAMYQAALEPAPSSFTWIG